MGKTGKISVIKKEVSNTGIKTLDTGLRQHGYTRMPGTGVTMLPYREASGKYRTGLDTEAKYLERLSAEEREVEIERITKLKAELQDALDVDLGPRSKFWNFGSNQEVKVSPKKLIDGDNFFDLEDPMAAITYNWLRVHPLIASSLQAWERGAYPAETQFYVADEEVENTLLFKKKAAINKAIVRLEDMTPEKRKKVARLLGLPVTDNTLDSVVYNHIDTLLKQTEFKDGEYKGQSTVEMFIRFSEMREDLINVKDLVNQAITHSIYRVKDSGRIFEGDFELASTRDELVAKLYNEDGQEDRLALEKKLSLKKTANLR
jgi:hypothetical protein